jgi:hypothetical protein
MRVHTAIKTLCRQKIKNKFQNNEKSCRHGLRTYLTLLRTVRSVFYEGFVHTDLPLNLPACLSVSLGTSPFSQSLSRSLSLFSFCFLSLYFHLSLSFYSLLCPSVRSQNFSTLQPFVLWPIVFPSLFRTEFLNPSSKSFIYSLFSALGISTRKVFWVTMFTVLSQLTHIRMLARGIITKGNSASYSDIICFISMTELGNGIEH